MNDFDKRLDFDSDTFEDMKHDMNFVLQRLLGNMIEKQSNEGSMTIKIDVTMVKEFIPNYDPNIKGESREISKPQFKHKVTSAVKITDEKGGNLNNEMEMVMDEETGCYVLQPIANTQQRTIFDSDFMQSQKQEGEGSEDIIDGTYIDADVRPALPGPADEENLLNLHNQLVWHLYRFDKNPRADAILYAVIEAILGEKAADITDVPWELRCVWEGGKRANVFE